MRSFRRGKYPKDHIDVRGDLVVAARESAEPQVFKRRHVGDDAATLHYLDDAAADDLVGIDAVDALAFEDDIAAGDLAVFGLEQTGDRLQRRRLARAVSAKQCDNRPFRHLKAQPAQHQDDVVIDHLDIVHAEQRRGSGNDAWSGADCIDGFGHRLCHLPDLSMPGRKREVRLRAQCSGLHAFCHVLQVGRR